MKKFSYRAKDQKGKTITGLVEARDEKEAAKLLQARKLLVISLQPKKNGFLPQIKAFHRLKLDDKVNFTRQLATMVTAGLPLTDALSILETQASPAMSQVVSEILTAIEGGGSLADALKEHPRVFDKVYVSLVRAGETAGVLDKVLERLAQNLEKQKDFESKVKGAMIYPVIIVAGMVIVALIMIVFVIPRLTVLYEEFEAELPLVTRVLLKISEMVTACWWLGLFGLMALFYLFRVFNRHPALKKRYDEFYFRLPVLGSLRRQILLAEFTRTLGLLVGTGILIVDALNIVKDSVGSPVYREALVQAATQVEKGLPLATALAQTGIFPPLLPQMIAVGEETGKVDEVLEKISAYFEQEAATAVKGLTTALEPLIMIVLGVGVGFLIIAVIMPIYNLTSQF